ncbi:MAG TPA: YciI family protein [Dehalococcoidia bacterium]|jgi:hypothetical protein|nr:YciI family protein [Dehalococcoidia bacterium]
MAEFMMIIAQDEAALQDVPQEQFGKVYAWWQASQQSGRLKAGVGHRLQPSSTAKTVSIAANGTAPSVTDGPFIEAKEVVGGYGIIVAATLEDAVKFASEWPGSGPVKIEVRPVMEM